MQHILGKISAATDAKFNLNYSLVFSFNLLRGRTYKNSYF